MRTQVASSPSLASAALFVPCVPPVTTSWRSLGTKRCRESQPALPTPALTRSGVPGGGAVPGMPPRAPPGVPRHCRQFQELPWGSPGPRGDAGLCSGGSQRAVHPGAVFLPPDPDPAVSPAVTQPSVPPGAVAPAHGELGAVGREGGGGREPPQAPPSRLGYTTLSFHNTLKYT